MFELRGSAPLASFWLWIVLIGSPTRNSAPSALRMPVVLLTDANLLSAMVDGTVLVVKAGSTSFDLVNRAVAALGRDRILGVVLNRATETAHDSYGYYNYYYGGSMEATPPR